MARKYADAKGRSESGSFAAIPHRCLRHQNFIRLTPRAIKLFLDLLVQYNGNNNGDLTAAFTIMKKRGWRSSETLRLAIDELLHYGWITKTRLGGLNRIPNLYAVTFHSIHECAGKLDVPSTNVAPGTWKQLVDAWVKPANYKAIDLRRQKKLSLRIPKRNGSYAESVVPIDARK